MATKTTSHYLANKEFRTNVWKPFMVGAAFFLLLIQSVTFCVGAETVDRVVAVVNDDIITLMDLKNAMAAFERQVQSKRYLSEEERRAIYQMREKMLDKLIDEKLTDQEIERLQLKVSDMEIDAAIEQIKARNYLSDEELRAALAQEGLSLEAYRENLKKDMLRPRLINSEVKSKIVITDEDIKAYYDAHKTDYAGSSKYRIWNLITRPSGFLSKSEKEELITKMKGSIGDVKDGVSIKEVVKAFSEASSENSGGELGLFNIDDLSPTLKSAISGLKDGEHTEVMDTPAGYQILYVEEIVDLPEKTVEDVSAEISDILHQEVVNEKFKSWLGGLREKSHIRIIK